MSKSSFRPEDFAYGDPDKLRAIIAELMAAIAMRSNMAGDYAYLRDDAGLQYTLQCAAAELRAALNIFADLKDQKQRLKKRQPSPVRQPASQKRTSE
ncbi:hypothetical protein [Methylobacterium sp. P1-11]|uniref:hypothetical protein n=1 Tax=Methylobacterium sp. P1-11 TaxID=2024616 RepID=UPI0011EE8AEA|nr:hypothetical protein [Methylobacterium sp. P1-11]